MKYTFYHKFNGEGNFARTYTYIVSEICNHETVGLVPLIWIARIRQLHCDIRLPKS